ncbi:Spectrin beta chain, non-erythrocytic 1 [Triplophysa tibetana]|uniref:Spectrin beta chain, non-erythrocytic 1 n=1 Tax=Triplophysa tibetana TaxID=1572043 RepID=A0A5A9NBR9_9TELE|nr:Spectrin beta chain, non-erythrocytic 1 [Triplophysa tibetana]
MTTVAAEYEHMDIQQTYQDSVNNRWEDEWDNENSSARLFERSRIKALAVAYFPLLFSISSAVRCALELLCLLRCDIVYERADRGEENALKATGRLLELKQMYLKKLLRKISSSLFRSDRNLNLFLELRKAPIIPANVLHFT